MKTKASLRTQELSWQLLVR